MTDASDITVGAVLQQYVIVNGAEAVTQAFLTGWVARFGVPSTIVTDQGRQFESKLWEVLTTFLGVKQPVQLFIILSLMAWL